MMTIFSWTTLSRMARTKTHKISSNLRNLSPSLIRLQKQIEIWIYRMTKLISIWLIKNAPNKKMMNKRICPWSSLMTRFLIVPAILRAQTPPVLALRDPKKAVIWKEHWNRLKSRRKNRNSWKSYSWPKNLKDKTSGKSSKILYSHSNLFRPCKTRPQVRSLLTSLTISKSRRLLNYSRVAEESPDTFTLTWITSIVLMQNEW